MRMRTNGAWSLVLLVAVYICVSRTYVQAGKCTGKWLIHSCMAGNSGKRSDSSAANRLQSQETLEKLLRIIKQEIKIQSDQRQLENPSIGSSISSTYQDEPTPSSVLWERLLTRLRDQEERRRRRRK
ncbi:uncharacterized protein LOC141914986 [Tubulanus polymorphus]|uniref:uncharacterized protein LOC141914986 n=1 Tax=Tubulanus polymorphus TaxID=672921 RepID=UPI003DA6C547